MDQVVAINQEEERFEVAGNLFMEWTDARLAFDAAEYGRPMRMLGKEAFARFAEDRGGFAPAFAIHNQQGQRWTQNAGVLHWSSSSSCHG